MDIKNLIEETEYFFEKITNSDFFSNYERKIGRAGAVTVGGVVGSAIAAKSKPALSTIPRYYDKDITNNVNDAISKTASDLGIEPKTILPHQQQFISPSADSMVMKASWNWTGGHELASMGLLGIAATAVGYQLYKYLHSFVRYKSLVIKLERKLKENPNDIDLKNKLTHYKMKLDISRKQAEIEERSNIEKLKEYEVRLKSMKKDNASKKDINQLISKIEVKRDALKRVGVILK